VIGFLAVTHQLMAKPPYGSGLRLMECLRLRVKGVKTTMIYTHVLNRGGLTVRSLPD
jgi:site-specific recombinase XerD